MFRGKNCDYAQSLNDSLNCFGAHGADELDEWKERKEFLKSEKFTDIKLHNNIDVWNQWILTHHRSKVRKFLRHIINYYYNNFCQ